MFSTFTNKSISEYSKKQFLIATELENGEEVERIVKLALENGGTRYKESFDNVWSYYDIQQTLTNVDRE